MLPIPCSAADSDRSVLRPDWLAKVRTGRQDGTLVAPSKDTVNALLDTWMLGARHLKPSTRRGYEVALKVVRARLGDVAVQRLTKVDVERLVEHMLTTGGRTGIGRAGATVRQSLIVFEQAIDDVMRQGLVSRNVVALVAKPRCSATSSPRSARRRACPGFGCTTYGTRRRP